MPDAGSSKQYFADPVGGWMYVATTTITVEQKNLNEFTSQLNEAKQRLLEAQALVDELEPQATAFETAIAAQPKPVVLDVPPVLDNATSTPIQ